MASTILAISPGWKPIGPRFTQICEPLTLRPMWGTSGRSSSPMPIRANV